MLDIMKINTNQAKPMQQAHKRLLIFATILVWTTLFTQPLRAGVTVNQAFTWGTIGMTDNNSPSSLTVLTNGSTIVTGSIVQITPAEPGIFRITELPPNTSISSITVGVISPMQRGASEVFTTANFIVDHPASATGRNLDITIGGRLLTTGSGTGYIDGLYGTTLELTINF